jgi:hypothetical protein
MTLIYLYQKLKLKKYILTYFQTDIILNDNDHQVLKVRGNETMNA